MSEGRLRPLANRLPVGPGSRGGRWGKHPPAAYFRAWRLAHPEYRERERRRLLLNHAIARLARVVSGGPYARPTGATL